MDSKSKSEETSDKTKSLTRVKDQPHDKAFKRFFSTIEYIIEFLKLILPKEVLDRLALQTLKLLSSPALREGLQERFMDLLFSVGLKDSHQQAKLVLLFEHRSTQSDDLLWKLFEYQVELYKKYKQPVLAIMVYTGEDKKWRREGSFQSYLASQNKTDPSFHQALSPYTLDFSYLPFLLPNFDIDNTLPENSVLSPILHSFQKIRDLNRDMQKRDAFLKKFFFSLKNLPEKHKEDIIGKGLTYFHQYKQDLARDVLRDIASQVTEEGEPNMIEEFDYTIEGAEARGRQEGLQAGRQEGLQAGRQEGLQTVAYRLLQQSMEIPSICQATGLSKEQVLALKKGLKPSS